MKKLMTFVKLNSLFMFLSFAIPIAIMAVVYGTLDIYPGGANTLLASDAFSQYANFHASLNNVLHGKENIFFSWHASLGLNYWALISYYLGGIFTPLVYFFDNQSMPEALYFLTLLKFGSMGLSFWIYAKNTFKINSWANVVLSVCYAQMAYIVAYSEVIMWFDGLIYLPLVFLGINRIFEMKKPTLLFISYLLLFISNFYMGFMIGLFSVMYVFGLVLIDRKKNIVQLPMYLITAILSGMASMIMVLPMIMDISNNGESLTEINNLKTKATGVFDIIVKNMIGVYDTSKYNSIPYIYIGLIPLILTLFFFFSKKVIKKEKIVYGSLFIVVIISFYFEPFNLFWHGLHAPYMFLFRFSFLFSFLVVTPAGKGWERLEDTTADNLVTIIIVLLSLFITVGAIAPKIGYTYLSSGTLILSVIYLFIYLFLGMAFIKKKKYRNILMCFLLLIVSSEVFLNSKSLIWSIASEWHYPKQERYLEPYNQIKQLVDKTKVENSSFYRMENLDPSSMNDSFNLGYNGLSMFSSIRNRHSSQYLSDLGFRSEGTNLNINYQNNTILMDSLFGIKYNISKTDVMKYGFEKVDDNESYALFENKNVLPLGILTDEQIFLPGAVSSQVGLFNHLSGETKPYFTFKVPEISKNSNVKVETKDEVTTFIANDPDKFLETEWKVTVPAKTQAYLSLYPAVLAAAKNAVINIEVDGNSYERVIGGVGQYYTLGYYEKERTVTFKTKISLNKAKKINKDEISFYQIQVAMLDIGLFDKGVKAIHKNGVDLSTTGRIVRGVVEVDKKQTLFTTIPYDLGWKAYIDGKRVEIPTFKDAFLAINIPKGKHNIEFRFMPQGFILGIVLFISCIILFNIYNYFLCRKNARTLK